MSYNLWWTWQPAARRLFRALDVELWDATNHNPIRMLQLSKQARLLEVASDPDFLKELESVYTKYKDYLAATDTYGKKRPQAPIKGPVAYFSAEFGFHESVPIYSGGLGILAGDHCKSASDLDLNFVAIGLHYKHGYFKQVINNEGWQESGRIVQNPHHLPLREVCINGKPLDVGIDILGSTVHARVWELKIGRISLFLLDTDLMENSLENRKITAELYGGDLEMRIKQEIVLGIGGVHALNAMGIEPSVFHMNEGHAAFLGLERVRRLVVDEKLDFYAAIQVVAGSSVFTTHTPVPAGNDAFARPLIQKYFGDYPAKVGLDFDTFMSFGQFRLSPDEPFSMTILALRCSRHANGVSKLHGDVSRGLWKDVWAGVPLREVPITSITNGIHTKTWLAPEFAALYDKYLGEEWEDHLTDTEFWRKVIDIPDEELWSTHLALKERLVSVARDRLRARAKRLGKSPEELRAINTVLDPEILTIGFARRFATYKRGNLLFSDPDRLLRMISDPQRPVQFLFAGKAHPADEFGKKIIQEVYTLAQKAGFERRLVFVEDYDTYIGRRLTQGVDLWLNNPLRPLEASGTSGMKLPPNGGLNLSVLDGWWCEGYNGKNGWAIGPEITEGSPEFQRTVDTASLYSLLENQVIPLYYAKPDGKLPLAWIQLMRESIRSVVPVFNTHRMVKEYNERLYESAARAHATLSPVSSNRATQLAEWKTEMRNEWPKVKITDVQVEVADRTAVFVGERLRVSAKVHLGPVNPANVRVQAYFGATDNNVIGEPHIEEMSNSEVTPSGEHIYSGTIPALDSGAYGLNVRVIPTHPDLVQPYELRLITWA
jgi:starch phosphorylase